MIQPKATSKKGKTPKKDTTSKNHQPTGEPVKPTHPHQAPANDELGNLTEQVTHLKKQLKGYKTALRALGDALDDALECEIDVLHTQFESLIEKRIVMQSTGDDGAGQGGPDP